MKSSVKTPLFIFTLAIVLLAGCGAPAATPAADYGQMPLPAATQAPYMAEATAPAELFAVGQSGGAADSKSAQAVTLPEVNTNQTVDANGTPIPVVVSGADRKIIKNAEVRLQVEDTDSAIDRTTQVIGDVGGYIISSRVWYQDYYGTSYKYATISMGVPVDQFETAMRRLRNLALKVLDENASGQDVTDQYVDLQSQLGNLEATRDRIRTFLEQAKTVDEALQVNQQLTEVEAQIEQVKGRMNYLGNRSAFSTITVTIEPKLPDITPTATPTAMPTATPTVWDPGKTLGSAQHTVTLAYQGVVESLIWLLVVFVPLLAPPALIIWLVWKFVTRKTGKPASGG